MSLPGYDVYNDTGLNWLGRVPAHWHVKRIRFVAELNPSKSELADLDRATEVSFLPMDAIGDDGSISLERTRPIAEVESGYTYFRDGDVTLAKITPCFENGKGALMRGLEGGIGFGTTELIVARPRPSEVDGSLLSWIFRSPNFRAQGEASMYGAGGQKRVPDDFVRDFAWAFPPLDEQTAIAAFLDRETAKIDALIAEQEKLIALLAEKRQATISHAVTNGLDSNVSTKDSGVKWLGHTPAHWKIGRAGFYISVLPGYAFPSTGFSLDESHVRLLRGINVGVGGLRWDEVVYWRRTMDDGLEGFELQVGDVVIGMDRPLISAGMRVAHVKEDDLPCLLVQRVAKVRPSALVDGRFIMQLLSSRAFEAHFAPETTGVSVPHISAEQISSFVIPVPPLDEQRHICDYVETELARLDRLNCEACRAIALLEERRSALIAAAVTGQIDVRGTVSASPTAREEHTA